jgi:lipopolysaccharide transport system permease protein
MQELIIKSEKTIRQSAAELWRYRELLLYFAWRDIKVKYKETVLGVLWVIMQPLVLTLVFTLVFFQRFQSQDLGLPYPLFVLSGLAIWNFAASSISDAVHGMEGQSRVIKKIYFPRLIVPLAGSLTAAFDLLFVLILVGVGCAWHGILVSPVNVLVALPLSLFITGLSSAGLACMFSILSAIFKDFRYVVPFFLQLLFFTSPVFYHPQEMLGGGWGGCLDWHPIAAGIDLMRLGLSSHGDLSLLQGMWKALLAACLLFCTGLLVFKKLEPKLADIL